jgi:hypothetical protein
MISRIKIGNFRASFVLRHRWEKDSKSAIRNSTANDIRKNWQLGIWAKRNKVVGQVKKGKDRDTTIEETFNEVNLVNNYMIGLNLIVCKVWVDFTFKPTFGTKIKCHTTESE